MAIREHAFPSLRSTGRVAYAIISVKFRAKKGTRTGHVPSKGSKVPVWVDRSQFFENRPRLLHRCHFGWIDGMAKEQLRRRPVRVDQLAA